MKVVLIIGARKQGKTTYAKKYLTALLSSAGRAGVALSPLIYDTTAQWGVPLMKWELFERRMVAARNSVILIEEATVNLDARHYSAEVQEAFIASRHNRCAFILLFHSLQSVPAYIFNLANVIYLFKTNDTPKYVEKRFDGVENMINAFYAAKKSKPFTPVRVEIN